MAHDTDGDMLDLARQIDAALEKAQEYITLMEESAHPNKEEIVDALSLADIPSRRNATMVVRAHLLNPQLYEPTEWGVRRIGWKT